LVTDDILQQAQAAAKIRKTPIIDELRRIANFNDVELYRTLAKQYNFPLGNVEQLLKLTNTKFFEGCSKAFLDHYHLVPLYAEKNSLKIATSDPDASITEIQQVFPSLKIEKILVTPTDFRRLWSALDLCSQGQPLVQQETLPENEDVLESAKPQLEAHLVYIFEALLLDAVAERASDIHLERYGDNVRVRLRVDGELHDLSHYHLTPHELKGLINVIKLRAELNIAEHRLPQGGRSRLRVADAVYDLRVQTQPSLHGEHVVIRLLPQNTALIDIEQLGLSRNIADNYKRLLRNPAGLVLVVGPTGSGKSTTLYSGLKLLAEDGRRKVITVEDPIEYSINGIQQTRVRPEIGFSFSDAMRSFVRQDPDVILVGEIRDQETALEAIRASQTGHVVLSTLHCNDAIDAMQRLYDLKIHPNSLASELLAVIAQRLAKKICPHCKTSVEPDMKIVAELFPSGTPDSFRCYAGTGCEHCHGTGTKGRLAVVEYLQANPDIRNAISRQLPIGELRKLALDCGLITMRDSALDHVIAGNIPLSELPRILPAERMAPEARWQWEKTS
jgi:type IV pilus assembly protein PilB